MSGRDQHDRPSECASKASSFNGDVLQLYRDSPRSTGNGGATPDHIDFGSAKDPYSQPAFDANQQRDIFKDIRDNHTNLHSFIKDEHKALVGSGDDHGEHGHHRKDHKPSHPDRDGDKDGSKDNSHPHSHPNEHSEHGAHHPKTIAHRLITQQSSIFADTKAGQISQSEFVQLEKDEHKIEGLKLALTRDGSINSDDRKQLNHAIDAEWTKLKSFKANSDTQPPGSGSDNPGGGNPNPNPVPGDGGGNPNPTPAPGDSGSPSAVTQLVNLNQKFIVSSIAKGALNDTPDPISLVQVEGKLPTEAVSIASGKSLQDMPRMEALGEAYQATKDEKYADKAKQYLLAWAKTNHSAGDPIDDAQITREISTYALIKDSGAIKNDPASQQKIETYLKSIADTELKSTRLRFDENWNAHRIEVIGNIGFALNDKTMISQSMDLLKKYIDVNIQGDGSTLDFHTRDAFYYHNYDLEPMLRLAEVAKRNGYANLFDYSGPDGGSLHKAIDFEVPYITGQKTHVEFKNSVIKFDRERAAAGESAFVTKNFDPKRAKTVIQLASALDPSYSQYDKYVD